MKPENILIRSSGNRSPYEWKFSLPEIDIPHSNKATLGDSDSSAPDDPIRGKLAPALTQSSSPDCLPSKEWCSSALVDPDIGSTGCILMEALAWTLGLEAFRAREILSSHCPEQKNRHRGPVSQPSQHIQPTQSNFEDPGNVIHDGLSGILSASPKSFKKTIVHTVWPMISTMDCKDVLDKAGDFLSCAWISYESFSACSGTLCLLFFQSKDIGSHRSTQQMEGDLSKL